MTFLELCPRLLAPHLVGLVVLWAAAAGVAAWGAWWIKRKLSTRWLLKVIYVAIGPAYATQPATLHRYAYVGNNPVNRVDPSGLR